MAEYIEREALLDEINLAPVSMSICMNVDECKGRIYERERLMRIINAIPAADVVEVVRCKDCYFYAHDQSDSEEIGWCGNTAGGSGCEGRPVYDSFFCACGSRRADNG